MSVAFPMRITFMGSPNFAIPALRALQSEGHKVTLVVTQPDRPAGRGRKLQMSPVKIEANALNIPVFQPESFKSSDNVQTLVEASPDLIVVAAYGIILPKKVLEIPTLGTLNIHPSLLPRWRGPSPIQSAILAGDGSTGISIIFLNEEMDAGPILSQHEVEISPSETTGELEKRLAEIGALALTKCVDEFKNGIPIADPQDEEKVTFCQLISKQAGHLRSDMTITQADRAVRAYSPSPGAFVNYRGSKLVIRRASSVSDEMDVPRGVLLRYGNFPAISFDGGILVLEELQRSGRARVNGTDFLNGERGVLHEIGFAN